MRNTADRLGRGCERARRQRCALVGRCRSLPPALSYRASGWLSHSCASILPPPPITSLPTWRCRSPLRSPYLAEIGPNRRPSRPDRPPADGPDSVLGAAERSTRLPTCVTQKTVDSELVMPTLAGCCLCVVGVCFLGVMAAVPPGNRLLLCIFDGLFARACVRRADFSITWSSAFLRASERARPFRKDRRLSIFCP